MLPMMVGFEPDAHLAEFGRHPGEEFVHVIQGTLELELEGSEPRILRAGDSAYYDAERPHLFRNASSTRPLRIFCVNSPSTLGSRKRARRVPVSFHGGMVPVVRPLAPHPARRAGSSSVS